MLYQIMISIITISKRNIKYFLYIVYDIFSGRMSRYILCINYTKNDNIIQKYCSYKDILEYGIVNV